MAPIPIVLGEASGKPLTLQDCITTHRTGGFGDEGVEPRESTLWAFRAFIGSHFGSPDQIRVERISAGIQHVGSFMRSRAFDIERDWKQRTHTVKMRTPDPIMCDLRDGGRIGIAYSTTGPNLNIHEGELTANVSPRVVYQAPDDMPFEKAWPQVERFQDFITMATGRPCHILSIGGLRSKEESAAASPAHRRRISVIYQPRDALPSGRPVHPSEMLFRFEEISASFSEYMANWYAADEDMRAVQNLYFSTRYATNMFLENRFMHLLQALESFHRLTFESTLMDDREYKRRASELLQGIADDNFRGLAGEALAFGNRKPLFWRLSELADRYGQVLTDVFGSEREEFLHRVKRTRNYHTHFDPKGKKDILEGRELVQAYRLLRIMMECCFLVELGMDPERANSLLADKAGRSA